MTDEGKYDFKTSTGETLREWSLKKELDEAELMIQDLKAKRAQDRDEMRDLELKLQKKDGDYQSARREALGFEGDTKRLREQLADA